MDNTLPLPNSRKRRQPLTRAACAECRVKKRRCNGKRPVCGPCAAHEQSCVYTTKDADETRMQALARENEELKRRLKDLEQYVGHLPGQNGGTSVDLVHCATSDECVLEAIVKASGYSLFTSSSSTRSARLVIPPAIGLQFENELSVAYPDLYPMSWKSNTTSIYQQRDANTAGILQPLPSYKGTHGSNLPDLSDLQISNWTTVPVTNDFAAKALRLYLQTDHHVLGLFDAELFVHDLLDLRQEFCSTLLVNSLLFWACVSS